MPLTFVPLATSTLSSSTSQLNFTSISGAYTDLFMVITFISDSSNLDYPTTLVGTGGSIDSSNSYSANHFEAASGVVSAYSYDNVPTTTLPYGQALSTGQYASWSIWFFDYSTTDKYKTVVSDYRSDASNWPSGVGTACWRNTSAIDCIQIKGSGGYNMAAGTYATIWGVLKA